MPLRRRRGRPRHRPRRPPRRDPRPARPERRRQDLDDRDPRGLPRADRAARSPCSTRTRGPRRAPGATGSGSCCRSPRPRSSLTVRECLQLYAGYYSAPRDVDDDDRARRARASRPAHEATKLSGGQRRRLDVALALDRRPRADLPRRADHRLRPGRPPRAPGRSSAACARSARRSCSPPTTWRRPSGSPTGSSSWRAARSSPTGRPRRSAGATAPPRSSRSRCRRGAGRRRRSARRPTSAAASTLRTERPMAELHELTGWALDRELELTDLEVRRPDAGGRLPGADAHDPSPPPAPAALRPAVDAPQPARAVLHPRAAAAAAGRRSPGCSAPTRSRSPASRSPPTARACRGSWAWRSSRRRSWRSTMAVVSQRENGILKRRRATPVPAAVLVISRALTATISSVAAVRADGGRRARRVRDRPAARRRAARAARRRWPARCASPAAATRSRRW